MTPMQWPNVLQSYFVNSKHKKKIDDGIANRNETTIDLLLSLALQLIEIVNHSPEHRPKKRHHYIASIFLLLTNFILLLMPFSHSFRTTIFVFLNSWKHINALSRGILTKTKTAYWDNERGGEIER